MSDIRPTTLQVMQDREGMNDGVIPGEIARGGWIENPPSGLAHKLLLLMILKSAASIETNATNRMMLADFRQALGGGKQDMATVKKLAGEIVAATFGFEHDDGSITLATYCDSITISHRDPSNRTGDVRIEWTFGAFFRKMVVESRIWAIIDQQTLFALKSSFAPALFVRLSQNFNLHHIRAEILPLDKLRRVLGSEMARWNDLNRFALKPAVEEINRLSRYRVEATPVYEGRSVEAVRLSWAPKNADEQAAAAQELAKHSRGRKARTTGTAETLTAPALPAPETQPPAFPETGGITYSPHWIKVKQDAGCNMDNQRIASDFRRFCKDRGIPLNAKNIEKTFASFCAKVGQV